MPPSKHTKLRKVARCLFAGMTQAQSTVKAKIHANIDIANTLAYKTVRNPVVVEELARLEKIAFDESVLSKKEKLQASATLSREIEEQLKEQIDAKNEDPEAEGLDHKLLDSYIKLGKRDDVLQGHQIQAETNPQDKLDAAISAWVMESREANATPNRMRTVEEEVIELEEE
jgi:hypothetical protein